MLSTYHIVYMYVYVAQQNVLNSCPTFKFMILETVLKFTKLLNPCFVRSCVFFLVFNGPVNQNL